MQHVYLDNAATTKVRPEVVEKMQHALAKSMVIPLLPIVLEEQQRQQLKRQERLLLRS